MLNFYLLNHFYGTAINRYREQQKLPGINSHPAGLTIAAMAPRGHVTGTDLAEQMLDIAKEHAAQKNINHYSVRVADVS